MSDSARLEISSVPIRWYFSSEKMLFYHIEWQCCGGIAKIHDPADLQIELIYGDIDPPYQIERQKHS